MFPDTSRRTDEEEVMDDFSLEGDSFGKVLDSIAKINHWLGGNRITKVAVSKVLAESDNSETIHIVDAGCGNGDMCRQLANLARKMNKSVEILGIDANPFTIKYATEQSTEYPEIKYSSLDIFSKEFTDLRKDILVSTLTLHHFKDDQIVNWISTNLNDKNICVVNDLERSAIAYKLFQGLCFITRMDEMNRKDGLVSILRGFKKKDLIKYSEMIGANVGKISSNIRWKWAFRFLWTIKKV